MLDNAKPNCHAVVQIMNIAKNHLLMNCGNERMAKFLTNHAFLYLVLTLT